MAIVKIPANRNAWPPEQARVKEAYHATRGESLESIAVKKGVDPRTLLAFNFQTVDPAEVNWYLKEKLQCTKTTWDGKNYVFSGGETVYIPHAQSKVGFGDLRVEESKLTWTRKQCIQFDNTFSRGCQFKVSDNTSASGDAPFYEIAWVSTVNRHSANIDKVAKETGVDGDLIRAIMFVETTHGYYDAPLAVVDQNKSILPMNINTAYWGDTFGDREALKKPYENIKAGALLIKRITDRLPSGSSIAQVATLYNNTNATQVTDYGKRVETVYNDKPWQKKE